MLHLTISIRKRFVLVISVCTLKIFNNLKYARNRQNLHLERIFLKESFSKELRKNVALVIVLKFLFSNLALQGKWT